MRSGLAAHLLLCFTARARCSGPPFQWQYSSAFNRPIGELADREAFVAPSLFAAVA
jgi:hypothetical protein